MPDDQATRLFENEVGTWDAEVEVWPMPGAPVQRSSGVSTNKLVGAWLVRDFKNETSGFSGHGIYGWDETKQAHVGTWVDSMRGSMVITHGTFDAATHTLTHRGELPRADSVMRWRETLDVTDADTHVFRSFVEFQPGTEHEMMKITYRRRR